MTIFSNQSINEMFSSFIQLAFILGIFIKTKSLNRLTAMVNNPSIVRYFLGAKFSGSLV